jgi:hypothetical protein
MAQVIECPSKHEGQYHKKKKRKKERKIMNWKRNEKQHSLSRNDMVLELLDKGLKAVI